MEKEKNNYSGKLELKILTIYNAIKNNQGIQYVDLLAKLNIEFNICRRFSKEIIPDLIRMKKIYVDESGGVYIAGFKKE